MTPSPACTQVHCRNRNTGAELTYSKQHMCHWRKRALPAANHINEQTEQTELSHACGQRAWEHPAHMHCVAVYRRQCICSQHTIMAPCNFAAQLHNTHIHQLQIISNATCMLIRTLLISTVECSHDTVATGWTESTPTALANQASFCIKE